MNKKPFKWILVIAWLIVIFMFSNQPAIVSDGNSRFVINLFKALGLNLDSLLGSIANFIVRKAAHFTEYLILFLLLYEAFREDFSPKKAIIFSIIIVFLYACSDEIHQLFVPGREGRFRDVMIDTSGGAAGLLGVMIAVTLKKSSDRKKKELIK
jgi:VanZ family protein